MPHMLILSPLDSIKYHVNNTCTDFIVELIKPIYYNVKCEISLLDIDINSNDQIPRNTRLFVYSDICVNSNVRGNLSPLLRSVRVKKGRTWQWVTLTTPVYITMNTCGIKRIRIYIRDSENNIPSYLSGELMCTLHIRPCES